MTEIDNAGYRLLKILQKGKEFPLTRPCMEGWTTLLNSQDRAVVLTRLANVMMLPSEVIAALRQTDPDDVTFNYWYIKVTSAFSQQNLGESWHSFITHIDEHVLTYLSMTARHLKISSSQTAIEQSDLLEIKSSLEALIASLPTSSVPTNVSLYILRKIRGLIESIDTYFITGALPIADATDAALGHALLNPAYREFLKDSEAGQDFTGLLKRLATLASTTTTTGVPQAIEMGPLIHLIGL